MNIINAILIILLSIIIIFYIITTKKEKKRIKEIEKVKGEELKDIFKERWDKEEKDFKLKKTELQVKEKEIESEIAQLKTSLKEKEKRYNEVNQDLDLYKKGRIEEIDSAAAEYEQHKQSIIDKAIEEYREKVNELFSKDLLDKENIISNLNLEIEKVQKELEVERSKRAAINEEIRRAREAEEKQDFYRIQLNPNDKDDIDILRSITPRLRHPEAINKVIWTGYYQKPLAELRKRAGVEGSGVYKITRLKTGEVYIGQAVNISTRWADHCKAALGVGTLASSLLHRVMAEDGPEHFTFEVIEEVEKNKLKERESYYINFYDSKNYGLNTISGILNK